MTPVTEDQVQALLSGLERREREALRTLSAKTADTAEKAGQMTARVTRLRPEPAPTCETLDGDVVDMKQKRAQRRGRISSKGFMFYTPDARSIPSS